MEASHDIYGVPELPSGNSSRPKVTFALFAYNQERYIRAAVEGALSQNYEALEIILSDDASSDNTFSIMQEVLHTYSGPHRVRLNRNVSNMGLAAHVNHVLAMAEGEIIVFAAGDDISLPTRVLDTVSVFARFPRAMAVSFADIPIDENGSATKNLGCSGNEIELNIDKFILAGLRAQSKLGLSGASRAIRREVYDVFGDLYTDCPAEDTPFLRRALYLGTCIRCDWPAIQYRIHDAQLSSERSIARMKSCILHEQYLVDLKCYQIAFNPPRRKILFFKKHIDSERLEFQIRRLRHLKDAPDILLVVNVFLSGYFSFREKFGLLKRFIRREQIS